jgi:hypothetical protein
MEELDISIMPTDQPDKLRLVVWESRDRQRFIKDIYEGEPRFILSTQLELMGLDKTFVIRKK